MRRMIALSSLFVVMCVTTSYAKPIKNILISATGWVSNHQTLNQPTVDFYKSAFPNATVTYGDYGNTGDAAVQAALLGADLLVIARTNYSSDYNTDDDTYYNTYLTIPIIVHSSYFTRSSRMNWEGGGEQGPAIDGNETTVTAEGAKIFGAEGTFDWWSGTGAFDRVGSGSVGTGKILATIGGYNAVVGWRPGDTNARGTTMLGNRLLFNFHVNGSGLPNTDAGMKALLAAVKAYVMQTDIPYNPNVTPVNLDGSVGTPISLSEAQVTLSWNAIEGSTTPVNPAVLRHNIYLSRGISANDPNVYLLDSVPQVHNPDPSLTDPHNEYGPVTVKRGMTYYWKIEEVIADPNGNPYPAGHPKNVMGELWSFVTVPSVALITAVAPAYNVVEAGNNLVLSSKGTAIDTYQWYKKGNPDIALVNGPDYSGVNTDTLTILDVQVADEGYYYCVGTNSLPSTASNRDTGPARVMTKRLMSHYPMESMSYDVNPNGITPDIVNGFNLKMASNDSGKDVPVLVANTVPGLAGSYSLKFNNPRANPADPNNVDAQYAQIDEGMVAAYQDISISAWVYSSGGSNWNRILDFGNDTNNYIFLCLNPGSVNNAVRFAVKVAGTEQSVTSPAQALPVGEWTFVTATLSGNTARLYINGERVAINTSLTNDPISFAPTTQNWIARSMWGAGDGYFNGMVDDLKIWNYGLSAQEVAHEYLKTVTTKPWVCDWEAWAADALMVALDVNDDCRIDMTDFATFAGKWLEDAYQISLP